VEQVAPRTVLDVGVGFGKWGVLCREILDVYHERVRRESWTTRIDGIEIHEPYRNPLWDVVYDAVHIGNAAAVLPTLDRYDLILCCDVIEHFERAEAFAFLDDMLRHGSVVIVTSPRGYAPQGAICGNVHETHRSNWSEADFSAIPHLYKDVGFTFMAVLAAEEARLRDVAVLHPLHVLGVKRGAAALFDLALDRARRRVHETA
jgi:hypothetical protein